MINVNINVFYVFSGKLRENVDNKKFALLDSFSIRFSPSLAIFKAGSSKICRGCSKPLYEAPDFKCHQISQSWHQIGGNLIPKSDFESI